MEQLKLKNGTEKEVYRIENNIHVTPAILQVSFLNEDILELEELFYDSSKTETMCLCDSEGRVMSVFYNYSSLNSITKQLNQVVGQTEPEYDLEGIMTVEPQTVYGDITTITLKQADLQEQLNLLKAENQALKQSQDIQDGAILEIAEMLSTEAEENAPTQGGDE